MLSKEAYQGNETPRKEWSAGIWYAGTIAVDTENDKIDLYMQLQRLQEEFYLGANYSHGIGNQLPCRRGWGSADYCQDKVPEITLACVSRCFRLWVARHSYKTVCGLQETPAVILQDLFPKQLQDEEGFISLMVWERKEVRNRRWSLTAERWRADAHKILRSHY